MLKFNLEQANLADKFKNLLNLNFNKIMMIMIMIMISLYAMYLFL